MALPRALRFADRRGVGQLMKHGRRTQTPLGQVLFAPAPAGQGRVLFVVPLRAAKKSSQRNLLRRRLSEWLRQQWLPRLRHLHLIFFISPGAASLPRADLRARAEETFSQLTRLFLKR